ncbi:unnamed protein product [Arctogadus glacialis]
MNHFHSNDERAGFNKHASPAGSGGSECPQTVGYVIFARAPRWVVEERAGPGFLNQQLLCTVSDTMPHFGVSMMHLLALPA